MFFQGAEGGLEKADGVLELASLRRTWGGVAALPVEGCQGFEELVCHGGIVSWKNSLRDGSQRIESRQTVDGFFVGLADICVGQSDVQHCHGGAAVAEQAHEAGQWDLSASQFRGESVTELMEVDAGPVRQTGFPCHAFHVAQEGPPRDVKAVFVNNEAIGQWFVGDVPTAPVQDGPHIGQGGGHEGKDPFSERLTQGYFHFPLAGTILADGIRGKTEQFACTKPGFTQKTQGQIAHTRIGVQNSA